MSQRCQQCEHPPGQRPYGKAPCACECHAQAPKAIMVDFFFEDRDPKETVDYFLSAFAKQSTRDLLPARVRERMSFRQSIRQQDERRARLNRA